MDFDHKGFAKETRPELLLLKRLNLQVCPLYAEEPIISSTQSHDLHDIVFSGFCLPLRLRRLLADEVRKGTVTMTKLKLYIYSAK